MPILEIISPAASPGKQALVTLRQAVAVALELTEAHVWALWNRVEPDAGSRPEWDGEGPLAPIVFVTCKETYDRAAIDRLLRTVQSELAQITGCNPPDVYVAVRRARSGALLVRDEIWSAERSEEAYVVRPIGHVASTVAVPRDEDWGSVEATVVFDPRMVDESALVGLEAFSHVDVIFLMHLVAEGDVERGTRHPRNNVHWPKLGILAQRAKRRPNRIGVTTCRLTMVNDSRIVVQGLDAVDGTPILDVKPYFPAMGPRDAVQYPEWVNELMRGYF